MPKFEVLFRGESEDKLHEWKPAKQERFEVSKMEAKLRYDALVQAGLEGHTIDGVIPYVVVLASIEHKMRDGAEIRLTETMLFQYAEPDAYVSGQWAEIPRAA